MEGDRQQQKPVFGYPAATAASAQTSYPSGATATNYAYPAPPPGPYYAYGPGGAYLPHPSNPRRPTFLHRAIVAFFALFVIIGCIYFIFWLALRPQLPRFSVSSASVTDFNISTSSSSSKLIAEWDISVAAHNPNKKITFDYSSIVASIYYGPTVLADTTLTPFHQDRRSQTSIDAHLATAGAYIDESTSRGLSADRSRGNVEFRMRIVAFVKFRAGMWRTRNHFLRVLCQHVPIGFPLASSPKGSLSGAPRECDVYL